MIIVDAFNKVSKMFNDLELIFTFDENTSDYAKKIIEQRQKTIEQKKQQAAKLRECIKRTK